MDSTVGKYGEAISSVFSTPDTPEKGKKSIAQSKALANIHGEQLNFETPPRCGEEEMDEGRDSNSVDVGEVISRPRQVEGNGAVESAQERALREEQESLELARALMAEEAMASYTQSLDYLTNNQDQFSDEDLAALQAVMNEEQHQHELEINADAEAAIDGDDNGDSYEFMLRLGERMGDVKSERWAQVAQKKIDGLPIVVFDPENCSNKKDANDCDIKCLVCQEEYCKAERLRKLPCGHCFHVECIDQWLLSKDFCPYCRTTLEKE
ncbi:unnamed protein product [Pseudo-nitzschia multistriata]|uniref:RING-type E3 ubiquitin transferase n=1 Tax=Pseudo-nitzschia multistriata TaxID=183589 RepID=A0A448Z7D8_9STRA|nr:unnamed protein product [Pseudo-nitzschia multistriata]